MDFFTPVPVDRSQKPISHESKLLALGSCFAVNMGEKFSYYGFDCTVNPLGILFQPQAIEKALRYSVEGRRFSSDEIFQLNGRWNCFDAHSDMSRSTPEETLSALNDGIQQLSQRVQNASHIVITLGTAWQYRHRSGKLVANCHKVPQTEFVKELDTVESIYQSLNRMFEMISSVNPQASVVFTISPVRHIKDGIVQNLRSKAHLITALHQFLEKGKAHYFPAYEVLMDELRDYRFYASDMLHPSAQAVDYIWEKFTSAWISSDALPIMDEVASVRRAIAHRPFNPGSAEHSHFTAKLDLRIKALRDNFGIRI